MSAPDAGPPMTASDSRETKRGGIVARANTRAGKTVLALGLAGLLVGGFAFSRRTPERKSVAPPASAEVTKAIDDAVKKAASAPAKSALVYRAIVPSLVFISTDKNPTDPTDPTDTTDTTDTDDPTEAAEAPAGDSQGTEVPQDSQVPRRRRPQPGSDSLSGLGTGVIVNKDGLILTAHHVIAGADVIEVTFADGTTTKAAVASEDPENDTAVLEPESLPEVIVPAVLAGGGRVGDEVYAVGHPLGLIGSMSAGVISGLGRSIPMGRGEDAQTLDGLIQFDAAVNPGNSGGPLLNRSGQVIGIVTALANPTDQNFFVGIGFAVPIETAGAGANGPGTGLAR
jgi:S1-C subfamily serine protease